MGVWNIKPGKLIHSGNPRKEPRQAGDHRGPGDDLERSEAYPGASTQRHSTQPLPHPTSDHPSRLLRFVAASEALRRERGVMGDLRYESVDSTGPLAEGPHLTSLGR